MGDTGTEHPAPFAKLILYPQYPEVRFSGFLGQSRCTEHVMNSEARIAGRVLLLGVRPDGIVFGYVAGPDSDLAREFEAKYPRLATGVLTIFQWDRRTAGRHFWRTCSGFPTKGGFRLQDLMHRAHFILVMRVTAAGTHSKPAWDSAELKIAA